MPREQGQKGEHGAHQDSEKRKALLLKYNSMSLDELTNEQANIETDLSNSFFDILSQNSIDFAEVDGQNTMDQVINQYITDGKIDANDPLTAEWLEKNTLSKNIEQIIEAKRGEESKKLEKIPLSRITNKVDRIQSVLKSLGKLSKVDQSAVRESLLEIDRLIDSGNSVDAYNLSKRTLSELVTKYKNTLEAQKNDCNSNYEYLKTKVSIYEKDGNPLPAELLNNLIALTKEARDEERLGNIREAIALTKTMKDLVDAWIKNIDTARKQRRSFVREDAVHLAKQNNENIQDTELINHKKEELQKILSEIQTPLSSDLSGQFDDINALANSGEYDKAIQKAQEVLEYTSLTISPKKDIRVKQSPFETPPTSEELKNGTKTLESGEFDENEYKRKGIQKTLDKVQSRLDFAHQNPGTLTPEEVSFLQENIRLVERSLENDNYKKAFEQSNTLAHEAALLVPLSTDYDYDTNAFKKAQKSSPLTSPTPAPEALFSQKPADDWEGMVLPETVILPVDDEKKPTPQATRVGKLRPNATPRNEVRIQTPPAIIEHAVEAADVLESLPKNPGEPSEILSEPETHVAETPARIDSRQPEDLFEDFDDITITEPQEEEPSEYALSTDKTPFEPETKPKQKMEVGETSIEQDFFKQGDEMNAEHQALAGEKRGFFSRVFDTLRPSRETPEDKLIRILKKEKWLQNIPNMSHTDVLVSLKKFGVDLTGGAVDEQLKNVAPLLRSNTETGEVFQALWDKYLETQVHEKKEWVEAIPNMDITRVYLNLEKFGINPDEDGRRDVKAKILALRNETGKRGEVFRMLFDRYIEIQNNNIRFLQYADKNKVIQFLKNGYKIDPTYYFDDTQNEKIIQQQKHIEELRTEYSTRGKVIDAAMKRLEQLHEESARAKMKVTSPTRPNSKKRQIAS